MNITGIKKEIIISGLKNLVISEEKALRKEQEILDNWTAALESKTNTLTSEELANIYEPLLKQVEGHDQVFYKKYYDIVHQLISNKRVDELNEKIGYNFMSLDFINELEKEF